MAAPTRSDIDQDKKDLENGWSATHAQWADIDSFTNGMYWVWSAEQQAIAPRASHRSNRGRVIIDHAVDNLLPYKPRFSRDKSKKDKVAQGKVDDVEAFADAVWVDCSMAEMYLPMKQVSRYLTKYNYAVLEVGFDEGLAEQGKNPFSLRAPHPYTLLLPPWEKEPGLAVSRTRWARSKLKAYVDAKREAGADNLLIAEEYDFTGDASALVDVVGHFTPEYISLVCPDSGVDILLQEKQGLGIVPLTHVFGGFGDMEANAEGMNPERMAQGLLWPVMTLIRQYDQVRSAKMELQQKAAWGNLVTPQDRDKLVEQLGAGGNSIIEGDITKMGYLPIPQLPQYLADFERLIDNEITEATFPRASFGQRDVGVDTVGQHAMMVNIASNRFLEAMEQAAYMVSRAFEIQAQMHMAYGKSLTVRGRTLSPGKYEENTHIDVSFPVTDEAVKAQRVQQGAALVVQGLKSRLRHWEEDQMLTNTSEEEDQLLEERVLAQPLVAAAFDRKKAQELGLQEMMDEEAAIQAQERLAGFAQSQASANLPSKVTPTNGKRPATTEAQMETRFAKEQEVPPAMQSMAGVGMGG